MRWIRFYEALAAALLGLAGYGGTALALWVGIEVHVLRVRRADEARRAKQSETLGSASGAAPTQAPG